MQKRRQLMKANDVTVNQLRTLPILCLDFDGVIHDYLRGWSDGSIYGDTTPGFWEWAHEASRYFQLGIFSSRSSTIEGRATIQAWMEVQYQKWAATTDADPNPTLGFVYFETKPAAMLTIDDRALTFRGDWGKFDPAELRKFKPWNVN